MELVLVTALLGVIAALGCAMSRSNARQASVRQAQDRAQKFADSAARAARLGAVRGSGSTLDMLGRDAPVAGPEGPATDQHCVLRCRLEGRRAKRD